MKRITITLLIMSMMTLVGCSGLVTDSGNVEKDEAKSEATLESMEIKTANDALERLKKGNEQYVKDAKETIDVSKERRAELENGQNPFAVILSCSDSRVVTSHIFNTGLGDIFDIKLAGNVVDDLAIGSIEYGVEHLGVPLLVVMGHESCGAVTAAYESIHEGTEVEGNIGSIVERIAPAVEASESIEEASHKNVEDVIAQLAEDEIIKHLVESGKLEIVGAYYDLDGHVEFLD